MGVLKWCKNNSKIFYFHVLFHISILVILLPTAEMVKTSLKFESSFEAIRLCPFSSLESSILNLSIPPALLCYAFEKESLWDGDETCSKTHKS